MKESGAASAMRADRPPRISFFAALPDAPAAWQFHSARVGARHQIAAAISRGPGPDLRIVTRRPPPPCAPAA